ncbi:MAG TPA: PilZ domain-containing protein [Candidatus Dormibacteraeota bacterium]|nr:PilZ domain-containing protein [Candidatus Dormibacteraeota bacterium]
MLFGRRVEKRVPAEVPVYLASLREPRPAEKTRTENVSPHGARVVTKRPWQPNEEPLITSAEGAPQLPVRVVYCRPMPNGSFRIGLEFRSDSVQWLDNTSDCNSRRT